MGFDIKIVTIPSDQLLKISLRNDFNDPASGVCFVAWEEWEGSKAAGCPFWLPKTTINTYWEGQDCSHLPVNIMTVWKSSRSCEI